MNALLDNLYVQVLDMSKTASIAILVVLLARLLLKKAPKVFSHALWAIVLIRLLFPVSIPSPVSMIPDTPSVSGTVINAALPDIEFETIRDREQNYQESQRPLSEDVPRVYVSHVMEPIAYLSVVWLAGMAVMLLYSVISYIKIRKRLSVVVSLRDNIFIADDIRSPFVIGLLRPKIYLPCNLGDREQEYIILHEQHHIKRLDHIMKALAFLALAIHWFNPLVWMAFILSGRDMEMSCDEAVIRKLGGDVRADYSASLLSLATGRRIIAGTPLAFGEGDTKGRIRNLANWRKPVVWVSLIAAAACVALAVGLVCNPINRNSAENIEFPAYQEGRTDYNAHIYDVKPFTLSIQLPDGWRAELPAQEQRGLALPFTPVELYKGTRYCGSVGYNLIDVAQYEDIPPEQFYRAVYNQLMLGSLVNWDNDYTKVRNEGRFCAATCKVSLRRPQPGQSAAEAPVVYAPGILAFDEELGVYIAMQLEPGAVDEETLATMAASVELHRKEETGQGQSGASQPEAGSPVVDGMSVLHSLDEFFSHAAVNEQLDPFRAEDGSVMLFFPDISADSGFSLKEINNPSYGSYYAFNYRNGTDEELTFVWQPTSDPEQYLASLQESHGGNLTALEGYLISSADPEGAGSPTIASVYWAEHGQVFQLNLPYALWESHGSGIDWLCAVRSQRVVSGDKLPTIHVMENTVSEIGRGTLKAAVELSDDDAQALRTILEAADWDESGTADCLNDCAVNLGGRLVYYHSDCGTFNEPPVAAMSTLSSVKSEENGKSASLGEEEQRQVHAILEKYITLSPTM